MRIFISWSGARGRALADVLHKWIPGVLQAARPYFSPDDISKGARWASEIGRVLEESRVGLICVTRESVNAPWVVFEAGALSKSLESAKVMPILFDLETTEVTGPLVQFQAAKFSKAEMRRVVETMNAELPESGLDSAVLESVFEMWWPKLDASVTAILERDRATAESTVRTERDLLEEILTVSRSIAKAQVRSDPRDLTHYPDKLVQELVAGVTQITSAATNAFDSKSFTPGLEMLHRPIDFLLRSQGRSSSSKELGALQANLESARIKYQEQLEEDDLPF
jgi:TIR domain